MKVSERKMPTITEEEIDVQINVAPVGSQVRFNVESPAGEFRGLTMKLTPERAHAIAQRLIDAANIAHAAKRRTETP